MNHKEKTEKPQKDNTPQSFNLEVSCKPPSPNSPTRLRGSDIDFLKNLAHGSKQRSPDRSQENPISIEESTRKELRNIFGECSRKIEEEAKEAARNKREKSVGKEYSKTNYTIVNHERARSCSEEDSKIKRKNPSACSTGKKKKRNIFSINSQENDERPKEPSKNRGAVTDKNFSEVKDNIEKSKELLKELYEDSKRMCMSKENLDTIKRDVSIQRGIVLFSKYFISRLTYWSSRIKKKTPTPRKFQLQLLFHFLISRTQVSLKRNSGTLSLYPCQKLWSKDALF